MAVVFDPGLPVMKINLIDNGQLVLLTNLFLIVYVVFVKGMDMGIVGIVVYFGG
jgi:hypothetical protein